ncbi:hypothetical protein LR48_Vigan07g174700 [Vigna angularis]|uniref:Uncharacterized protein n=1 Tax=Phaseolus angularis TaxID=3914 RepID=A0A0L9UZ49_PHAAN|nr:hypothetical protein LR48_Vigan07g174700 [Vigna angularis]
MPLYRQKCEIAKKNRTSEKGGCLHTRGSISVHEHAIRLSQELGRSVHVDEIFQQTHIRQSIGEFVDERSKWTHQQFQAKFAEIRSETASVGASACSPLDPTEEERLRNRCWLEAVGGKYKGRVYGIGNLEKFQGFLGVLLPFLSPSAATAAQDFLNFQNSEVQNQAPNDVQPKQQPPEQQPPEQQSPNHQPQDGNNYMQY